MTATFELDQEDLKPLILQYLSERLQTSVELDDITAIDAETDENGAFASLTVRVVTDS